MENQNCTNALNVQDCGRRLLKASAAAKYLSIDPDTLYLLARTGKIPSVRGIGKRRVRFDIEDLDKFIEEQKQLCQHALTSKVG